MLSSNGCCSGPGCGRGCCCRHCSLKAAAVEQPGKLLLCTEAFEQHRALCGCVRPVFPETVGRLDVSLHAWVSPQVQDRYNDLFGMRALACWLHNNITMTVTGRCGAARGQYCLHEQPNTVMHPPQAQQPCLSTSFCACAGHCCRGMSCSV
jgi:hypothetical protein